MRLLVRPSEIASPANIVRGLLHATCRRVKFRDRKNSDNGSHSTAHAVGTI